MNVPAKKNVHVEYFECYICDATIPEEEEKDIEVCEYCYDTAAHERCLKKVDPKWKRGQTFVCPNCDPSTWKDSEEETEGEEDEADSPDQINSR